MNPLLPKMCFKVLLKSIYLLTFVLITNLIPIVTQSQNATCSFEDNHNQMMQLPGYQSQMQTIMTAAQSMMQQFQSETNGTTYTVPIVFHIIHNAGVGNISNAQVQAQLDRLNADFAGNPNSVTGASMGIQFCFAQNTPDNDDNWADYGSNFPGITRHDDPANSSIATGNDGAIVSAYGFPASEYFNVYVIPEIIGNTLGYSNFSGGLGVVQEAQVTGDVSNPNCSCTMLSNYDLGMVLVHEVGHFFNLPHPWGLQTGECTEDDNIADTPVTNGPNYFCPSNVNSCPETPAVLDQVENYMDYTYDACKNTFTAGQRCVAHAVIQNNPIVANLVSLQNLIRTGVAGENGCLSTEIDPTPEFSTLVPCTNTPFDITIFNDAGNTIDQWEIVLTNGTVQETATGTNTTGNIVAPFTLTQEGSYTVNITIVDLDFSPPTFSATFPNAIYASECEPICDGAFWHFAKTSNGDFGVSLNFSNGVTAQTYELIGNSDMLADATYTYSCGPNMFYTDGRDVYGEDGDLVVNGFRALSANGCSDQLEKRVRSNQGVIGVPASDGVVDLFMVTDNQFGSCQEVAYGLSHYQVNTIPQVEVVTGFPGNSPAANYSFVNAITVIPRCQGDGHWIITKGASDQADVNQGPGIDAHEQILAYPFDGSALGAPVISSSGPYMVDPATTSSWNAHIEASPDGRWFIFSAGGAAYIYEFNALTGTASFKHKLDARMTAFSASGDILYALNGTVLSQYDFKHFRECCELLPAEDIDIASAAHVQRGPDDKLYLWRNGSGVDLDVVNTPDILIENGNDAVVNYIPGILQFPIVPALSPWGAGAVPNVIEATSSEGVDFYCCVSNCRDVTFRAEGCSDSYSWDLGNNTTATGNTASTTYQQDGVYTVTLTTGSGMQIIKDISIGLPVPPEIFPEGNLCISPAMTYNTNLPDMEYEWSVTSGGMLVSNPSLSFAEVIWDDPAVGGTVCLQVKDPATGCASELICFTQEPCEPCTSLTITEVVTPACDNDGTITLTVTGGSGFYSYTWSDPGFDPGPNQVDVPAGVYGVTVTDAQSEDCTGELQIIVPLNPDCGGSECEEPIDIEFGLSPEIICYESDEEFTYYYVNIWIGNWGNQNVPFDFCSEDYRFSVGELLNPFVSYSNGLYELGGFLQVPNASAGGEVCVEMIVCQNEEEICARFCFDLPECREECSEWEIEAQVTQTPLGVINPAPCGNPGYEAYSMDFAIDITIPSQIAGHDFTVGIWSSVGELCTEGFINGQPGIINAPVNFQLNHSSLFNAYNLKHFCFHILLRDETTGEECTEYFCIPLADPLGGEFAGGGFDNLGGEDKGKEGDGSVDVKGVKKTGEVIVEGVEDGFWAYEVYSITGQFLENGKLTDSRVQRLNFNHLTPGYYLIRLQNKATQETQVEQFIRW